jgi:hypothetical protein
LADGNNSQRSDVFRLANQIREICLEKILDAWWRWRWVEEKI